MNPAAQSWLQVAVLLMGIGATLVAAIAYQTHYIDKRIEGLRDELKSDIAGLRDYIEARFKALEDRLDRLEHPVTRP